MIFIKKKKLNDFSVYNPIKFLIDHINLYIVGTELLYVINANIYICRFNGPEISTESIGVVFVFKYLLYMY
jgi:hypothetical protein